MPLGRVYQPPQFNLNTHLNWNNLGLLERNAFRGVGKKVRLPARFRLYKLTEFQINPHATPWWSALDPYEWDAGLLNRLHMARRLGVSPKELTQVVAAVCPRWNGLSNIVTATLLKSVWGFWGQIAGQPRFENELPQHLRPSEKLETLREAERARGEAPRRLMLPGSAGQFYIPNLVVGEHIQTDVPVPVESWTNL